MLAYSITMSWKQAGLFLVETITTFKSKTRYKKYCYTCLTKAIMTMTNLFQDARHKIR